MSNLNIVPFILDQFTVLVSVGNDELTFKACMDNLKITITQTLYQGLRFMLQFMNLFVKSKIKTLHFDFIS